MAGILHACCKTMVLVAQPTSVHRVPGLLLYGPPLGCTAGFEA